MLNVIKSIIITMISLAIALVSYIRGPLLVGLLVGASIMVFANEANAGQVYAPYQCNTAACPFFEAMSFSEVFGFFTVAIAVVMGLILLLKDKNNTATKPKSAFQEDLDKVLYK